MPIKSTMASPQHVATLIICLILVVSQANADYYRRQQRNYDHQQQQQHQQRDYQQQQQRGHKRQQGAEPLPPGGGVVRDKLLIVVIDGLRWDYIDRFTRRSGQEFLGFREFTSKGVRTEYLQSVFPSESFPSWQTINTGLYPEHHGILADRFFDTNGHGQRDRFFNIEDERTTSATKWWSKAEPIWATALRNDVVFSAQLWARCDIAWYGSRTMSMDLCDSVYKKDDSKTLYYLMERALIHFQLGNADAAIVYDDSLGRAAEEYGPLSRRTEEQLRSMDRDLQQQLARLREVHMEDKVNIIIMSDHGMTYGSNPILNQHPHGFPIDSVSVRKVHLGKELRRVQRKIHMVVGSGAYSMIYPHHEQDIPEVVAELRLRFSAYRGVHVYTRDEIPDHLHWRDNSNIPPILVLAEPGTVLLRAGSNLQRPASVAKVEGGMYEATRVLREQTKQGISGYDPQQEDMRGVFMARGPGFINDGSVHDGIELVDVYQIFCHLLGFEPNEHDGVWERVKAMLRNTTVANSAPSILVIISVALLALFQGHY